MVAARQYYEREGHLQVPRKHVETVHSKDGSEVQFRLGAWVSNQRSRAATLTPDRMERCPRAACAGHDRHHHHGHSPLRIGS
ncbi:helicase associated domain-containing protein [Streptomyces sp. NPDC006733]|uniref:helicase associated domain-containing protein n=1 Tax=Streptomyces sp. NPDC006733 TaxID=3155460 RepID=UPI0033EE7017